VKNIYRFCFAVLSCTTVLSACKKDEQKVNQLQGNWQLSAFHTNELIDEKEVQDTTILSNPAGLRVNFLPGDSCIVVVYGDTIGGHYSYDKDNIYTQPSAFMDVYIDSGSYYIMDGKLNIHRTLESSGGGHKYTFNQDYVFQK